METRITEIFYSLSGEGISQGMPTVFIRMAGCSLRCGKTNDRKLWCDTEYSLSPNSGRLLSIDSILREVDELSKNPTQVIITGGEPLEGINRDATILISILISEKRKNSIFSFPRIETNGKESIIGIEKSVFTLDYKLPGSGMESEMNIDNFAVLKRRNNPLDEIKFVVRDKNDFERSLNVIQEYALENFNLLFSPVFNELPPNELSNWIKNANLSNSRLSIQLHKFLWGNVRGV
jgi:7-carboxy-7-deazaguanine synthase